MPNYDLGCNMDDVNKMMGHNDLITGVLQAVGGLLFTQYFCGLSDRYGRGSISFVGMVFWLFFQALLIVSLVSWSMWWCWCFTIVAAMSGAVIEGTALAMVTEVSDSKTLSTNLTNIICAAILGYLTSLLFAENSQEDHYKSVMFPAILCILCSLTLLLLWAYANSRHKQQASDQDREEEDIVDTEFRSPVKEALSAVFRSPGKSLLIITVTATPLAFASMASLKRFIPARFDDNSGATDHLTKDYFIPCLSAMTLGSVLSIFNCLLSRNPNRTPQRRDHIILLTSAFSLGLGSLLIPLPSKGCVIAGMVFAALGVGVVPYGTALLFSFVGSRIRAKFAGRVAGVIYTLQCATTLIVLPIMNIISRRDPASRHQFTVLIVGCVAIVFAAARVRVWPVVQHRRTPALDGLEFEELDGELIPRVPPPAYVAHGNRQE
ncbi:major facilitator superfamily transporter [Colletotrichum truncatum]|uniref:Major facilitator superfamily transporter n=1 Tax=Colletotrichum truncatum TaxID=5467 RepID=A0ACC3ZEB9_COLTU|nr:major facilitator superfamily transporter [Colletotrichum truncatum]KAF6794809.1 major facilitator superfamily transporter [Colletotrichum truncatum]